MIGYYIDQEALGIYYAVRQLAYYSVGKAFVIETNHKGVRTTWTRRNNQFPGNHIPYKYANGCERIIEEVVRLLRALVYDKCERNERRDLSECQSRSSTAFLKNISGQFKAAACCQGHWPWRQ